VAISLFLLGSIATLCITRSSRKKNLPPGTEKAPSELSRIPLPRLDSKINAVPGNRPPLQRHRPVGHLSPSSAQVAIVIDDLGRESSFSHQLLQWNLPSLFPSYPLSPIQET